MGPTVGPPKVHKWDLNNHEFNIVYTFHLLKINKGDIMENKIRNIDSRMSYPYPLIPGFKALIYVFAVVCKLINQFTKFQGS